MILMFQQFEFFIQMLKRTCNGFEMFQIKTDEAEKTATTRSYAAFMDTFAHLSLV